MSKYLQHFGLKYAPLGKHAKNLVPTDNIETLTQHFQWSLEGPGLGLLTGEPGVGKTVALAQLCQALSPHQYQVIYHCETDFGRVDIYRQLALDLGIEPAYRRASMWRLIKQRIQDLTLNQQCLPVWIIDEAQNLPTEFFRDFPSFINFAFDNQALMTVWFVGHPSLRSLLSRNAYDALRSRLQVFVQFDPITQSQDFHDVLLGALNQAGAQSTLMSDPAIELIRLAANGRLRQAGQILAMAMQLAMQAGFNHIPDEVVKKAIEGMRL